MQDRPAILLVDDIETNLMALREVLRREDCELLCAQSGPEALELLLTRDIAVALVDVQMPDMDGFELAELLRGVERTRRVPLMFVTASLEDRQRSFRGYEVGAVDFLFKPIEPDVLRGKVNVFLELYRQRVDLTRQRDALRESEEALRASEERLRAFAGRLEQLVEERTQELVRSYDQLRAMATELTLTEQRERQRFATELHDHLQQMLVLCKLKLGQGKRLTAAVPACADIMREVDETVGNALAYSRSLVAELSPPVLREYGLPAALKWLAEWMQKMNLSVAAEIDEHELIPLPEAETVLLFQSVRELLINAAKYAGTGQAMLRLGTSEGQLRIEVRDHGAGFDPAASATGAASPLSSKFGLFSIRERMRALGGSFDIQSLPGAGTTATLVLPLRGGAAAETLNVMREALCVQEQKTELTNASRITDHASRIRVLLVDDHAMMRQGLRAVLESYADIELVGEAGNGEEAVALTDCARPAVVIMDINMPKMNGIDATAQITSRHADTAVIGLSVNAEGDNQDAMLKAGARVLLTKEAAVEQLYGAIQEAVGNAALRRDERYRL